MLAQQAREDSEAAAPAAFTPSDESILHGKPPPDDWQAEQLMIQLAAILSPEELVSTTAILVGQCVPQLLTRPLEAELLRRGRQLPC